MNILLFGIPGFHHTFKVVSANAKYWQKSNEMRVEVFLLQNCSKEILRAFSKYYYCFFNDSGKTCVLMLKSAWQDVHVCAQSRDWLLVKARAFGEVYAFASVKLEPFHIDMYRATELNTLLAHAGKNFVFGGTFEKCNEPESLVNGQVNRIFSNMNSRQVIFATNAVSSGSKAYGKDYVVQTLTT